MAAIAACEQPQVEVTPALDLNKTAATVTADGGAVEFEVTANVDWTADADQDWVSVDPQTGNGNAKVKATVAPNETESARTATVTVKADKLTKTLKITQSGKAAEDPGQGEDPTPGVSWGLMGCFVDNLWSTDVPMTQEGEWAVAKGAQFTELTFKIRGNASWDDATNIGYAPGTEKGYVNGKLSVVTAEYAKANLGGDSKDIKLDGEPGTYDVYFSFEKLEVYVMEEGSKPGEKDPVIPSEPKEVTYTIAGTLNGINWNNASAEGLMTKEGAYHVAKNVPFVTAATLYGGADQIEFKVCETGTWDAFGVPADAPVQSANAEITVVMGGGNICVAAAEGAYDVYLDAENGKVWVMTPGSKPGDNPGTSETPVTEGVIWENDGTAGASSWAAAVYRFSIEGGDAQNECVAELPAAIWAGLKVAPFSVNFTPTPGAEWWQIRVTDGWWSTGDMTGDSDITINTPGLVDNGDGSYTFQVDLTADPAMAEAIDTKHLLFAGDAFTINKIYFGAPETPEQPEPTKSDWHIVGSFTGAGWGWDAAAGIALSVLDENYFVYYGLELPADAQWKFLQGTAWGGAEVGADRTAVEPNTIQAKGGSNIYVTTPGKYDIYLSADATKYYVMSEGKTPAEATEPAPVEVTYTVTGTIQDNNWNNMAAVGLMAQEGAYYVAKNVPFVTAADLYGGAAQLEFKICQTGSWDAAYGAPVTTAYEANTEIPVQTENAQNIAIAAPSGAYDVYFDKDNAKVWVMEPGLEPGETPETPAQVVYADDFSWFADIATAEGAGDSVGTDNPSANAPNVFTMGSSEAFLSAFAERGYKFYWGTVGSTEFTEGPDPDQKDSRVMYIQSNYLKFGKTSWNGAISLPALSSIEGAADVVIEFDWCWQVTGAYKPDLMTLSVDATAGTFAATGAATSAELESAQSTVDGESHIEWQHVVVELNGATAETILTIRPTNADPDIQNAARHQNRWYLDNIKVSTK